MASLLLLLRPEALVTNRTLTIVATLLGSALGAWWITSQRRAYNISRIPAREHGTVIFDNTPTASSTEGII